MTQCQACVGAGREHTRSRDTTHIPVFAERDDVIAVIAHQRRHQHVRQAQRTGGAENEEVIGRHLRLERVIGLRAPAGQQGIHAGRIDHGAGEDMRADLGALLQHDDRQIRIDLFQADRGGEPRRAGADDDDVELHAFALRQCVRQGLMRHSRVSRQVPKVVWNLSTPLGNRLFPVGAAGGCQ